jgi:hypothetical protein
MSHLLDSSTLPRSACGLIVLASALALAQSGAPLTDSELVERLTGNTFSFENLNGQRMELHFGSDARFLVRLPSGEVQGGSWRVEGDRLCVDSWRIFCSPLRHLRDGLEFARRDGSYTPFVPQTGFSRSDVAPAQAAPSLVSESTGPAAVRPGDSWTFDLIEKDGSRKPYTETVLTVLPDQTVTIRRDSSARRVSSALNPYDTRGIEIPLVRLPLAVGKTWEFSQHWVNPPYRGENRIKYKVVALERLQLPSGDVEAFRISADGPQVLHSHASQIGPGRVEQTYWYAPELKRIVKFTGHVRWSVPGNRNETWAMNYELRSSSLARREAGDRSAGDKEAR